MNLSREDLIKKLEKISVLYKNLLSVQRKMDSVIPEDNYERKVSVPKFPGEYKDEEERQIWKDTLDHVSDDAIEVMGMAYDRIKAPQKPEEPTVKKFKKPDDVETHNRKAVGGCFCVGAGIVSVLSFFSLLFSGDLKSSAWFLFVLIGIAVIGGVVSVSAKAKENAEYNKVFAEYNKEKQRKADEYNTALKAYEDAYAMHLEKRKRFLEEYAAWREIYLEHLAEERNIKKQLEADRKATVKRIYESEYVPAQNALADVNDMVAEEDLPALDKIIDLLKSGRADDLKEAINLYEDISFRERELALEREKEEARRNEEERRREDEERRYQEDMEFRKEQERQRQYEEQRRQRQEADKRAKEEKERADREKKAASDAKREAEKRCHWCKKWFSCGIRRNPPLNCPAFEPDSTNHI